MSSLKQEFSHILPFFMVRFMDFMVMPYLIGKPLSSWIIFHSEVILKILSILSKIIEFLTTSLFAIIFLKIYYYELCLPNMCHTPKESSHVGEYFEVQKSTFCHILYGKVLNNLLLGQKNFFLINFSNFLNFNYTHE